MFSLKPIVIALFPVEDGGQLNRIQIQLVPKGLEEHSQRNEQADIQTHSICYRIPAMKSIIISFNNT